MMYKIKSFVQRQQKTYRPGDTPRVSDWPKVQPSSGSKSELIVALGTLKRMVKKKDCYIMAKKES